MPWVVRRSRVLILVLAGLVFGRSGMHAAHLKPESIAAWEAHGKNVEASISSDAQHPDSFLVIDHDPALRHRLRQGEIVVKPSRGDGNLKVPSALIHDWIGFAFIPQVNLRTVMAKLQQVERFPEVYQPSIVSVAVNSRAGNAVSYHMLMREKVALLDLGLDGNYQTVFHPLDGKTSFQITRSDHLTVLKSHSHPGPKQDEADDGLGFIWRVLAVSRYKEADGGVYVELRALSLSRTIPPLLSPVVHPIVSKVSQETLVATLRKTRQAFESNLAAVGAHAERISVQ